MKSAFPALSDCDNDNYLSLHCYLAGVPEKFYCHEALVAYEEFFIRCDQHDAAMLAEVLVGIKDDLHIALATLGEINEQTWHDEPRSSDELVTIRRCDAVVLPTYLRLLEGVLHSFVLPIASFHRQARGKSTDGLGLFNCVEELATSDFACLVAPYDNTIRNGIAHGNVSFGHEQVTFRDKKGNSCRIPYRELLDLVDNTLDVCNACALALRLCYISRHPGLTPIPRYVSTEELRAQTSCYWWNVNACVPSEIAGRSQLVIYAEPATSEYSKVMYSAIVTGVLAEAFAPGFDRYFVAMRSPKSFPGWARFDGAKLREGRQKGRDDVSDYKGALDEDMVFFVPRFRWLRGFGWLSTFLHILHMQLTLAREDLQAANRPVRIIARTGSLHVNGWRAVVRGSVVIAGTGDEQNVIQCAVRESRRQIVRACHRAAKRELSAYDLRRYLPVGYARIAVFSRDYRRSRLNNFGLGEHLIGTVQMQKISRIRAPDISGATIELIGKYRLAWNRAWMEIFRRVAD